MARAREFLRAGRAADAVSLLLPLHAAEPADEALTVLTARALVFAKPATALALVADLPPQFPWADGVRLVQALAATFARLPTASAAEISDPLQTRYHEALRAL